MNENYNKRRIAKNTAVLYLRLLFTMAIGLYTGRVVLEVLGVDDYGIYVTVGGLTGFMGFISNALATGTARFITCGLGKGDKKELESIFSSALNIHILMALVIFVISEPVGLWMIYNKLNFQIDILSQVLIVFHCSIISVCLGIIMTPFNASIIAHERMNTFAYMSIFDTLAKLGILYLLLLVKEPQRLGIYAILGVIVSLITTSIYIIYCVKQFHEVRWRPLVDKKIFKSMGVFSGWSIFATTAWALNTQGILIILNMFFSPAVVAARAVSLTVNNAANSFVGSFRSAVNPQIVKSHAAGQFDDSQSLLLESTKYSFFLCLFISFPAILLASPLLNLWLVDVPPYAIPFLQLVLIQSLIQIFDNSFYTALYAKGELKQNALLSPLCLFICFPIVYLCFKFGSSPLALSWCMIVTCAVIAFVVKPILLVRVAGYNYLEIWKIIGNCFLIAAISIPIPTVYRLIMPDNWTNYIITCILCVVSTSSTIWILGLDVKIKKKIETKIKTKLTIV